MSKGVFNVPVATNEPVKSYEPGSAEREELLSTYQAMYNSTTNVPLYIGGETIHTSEKINMVPPHNHQHVLGNFYMAGENEVSEAIESSMLAWNTWSKTSLEERTKIFRKAAELLQGPWRDTINAATMLNQSKNAFQAEIDAACELIDFFNFNCQYAEDIHNNQPLISPEGCLLYTSPSPRDEKVSRMPSSA